MAISPVVRSDPSVEVQQAAESYSLEQAREELINTEKWIKAILARLEPHLPTHRPLKVLDVGAAQGRALIALTRQGHEAYGVEPWAQAREVAAHLAAAEGVEITLRGGTAENIPYDNSFFDLVLATSVIEHVDDVRQSFREISRVLKPGGLFWFNSASALCPRQDEITGFPLFGWYPDPLKRRIMNWAKIHRPALVGHTEHPAINWWTPWKARRLLRRAGFSTIWDRWELRRPSEGANGWRAHAIGIAQRNPIVRLAGDVVITGCSYAARKDSAPL
ncbi:MAG: class I SAM-dependent methyltransferase [Chloroflexi bacterium]|nr:class I SAM-dependent methyltransferase [Chloroflexota bacterium]